MPCVESVYTIRNAISAVGALSVCGVRRKSAL